MAVGVCDAVASVEWCVSARGLIMATRVIVGVGFR